MMRFILASLLSIIPAFAARGELYTQTREIAPTKTDWSQTISFDPFDQTLGQLWGESLAITANAHSDFLAKFTAPSTITLTAGPTSIDVSGLGSPAGLFIDKVTRSATGEDQTIALPPSDDTVSRTLPVSIDPSGLTLQVTANGADSFSSDSGNGSGIVTTLAGVDMALSYCYTPNPCPPPATVPEPATMIMALAGIVGSFFMRNRLFRAG